MAQTLAEQLTLASKDELLAPYGVLIRMLTIGRRRPEPLWSGLAEGATADVLRSMPFRCNVTS
jgi:hypothetical protein